MADGCGDTADGCGDPRGAGHGIGPVVMTPWIAVDPDNPDLERHPLFALASPVEVVLDPGDILFLPACWYHQVKQEGFCVSVNAWYDMKFGASHSALNAASAIGKLARMLPLHEQTQVAKRVMARAHA